MSRGSGNTALLATSKCQMPHVSVIVYVIFTWLNQRATCIGMHVPRSRYRVPCGDPASSLIGRQIVARIPGGLHLRPERHAVDRATIMHGAACDGSRAGCDSRTRRALKARATSAPEARIGTYAARMEISTGAMMGNWTSAGSARPRSTTRGLPADWPALIQLSHPGWSPRLVSNAPRTSRLRE